MLLSNHFNFKTNGGRHQAPIQQQQYPQQPGYPYPPVSMQQTSQPPQSVYQYPSNMQGKILTFDCLKYSTVNYINSYITF